MAYDKVVDSAQLEAAIKATADAIREKTGNTALIDWVESKGFEEAIAAIQSGGNVYIGTYTPATDETSFTIEHNLGYIPYILLLKSSIKTVGYYRTAIWQAKDAESDIPSECYYVYSTPTNAVNLRIASANMSFYSTVNESVFSTEVPSTNYSLLAGTEYLVYIS